MEHFLADDFLFRADGTKQRLKDGSVPSVFSYRPLPKPRRSRDKKLHGLLRIDRASHGSAIIKDHGYSQDPNSNSIGTNFKLIPKLEETSRQEENEFEETYEDNPSITFSHEVPTMCHICHMFSDEAKWWKEKIKKNGKTIKTLRQRLKMSNQSVQRMQSRLKVLTAQLHKARVGSSSTIFAEDQIACMEKRSLAKSDYGLRWTNTTIKQGLKLRFACGQSGYDALLKQKFPLPSLRTLQRRTKDISFDSGILFDVFSMMALKTEYMSSQDRICCLLLDEMAITSGNFYDSSTDSLVGHVTLPDHDGDASKALVVMLGGIAARWKQTVAYFYTGNSTNGKVYANIIKSVIHEASKIGLKIVAVTSDMGTPNLAMWREFGVIVGRDSSWTTCIPNPSWEGEALSFLADRPHLLKNIRASLSNGNEFRIPESFRIKANLPQGNVSLRHVKELLEFDSRNELKLAPKLD
eukprot:TCALIF_12328-PA protein Name:"Similar to T Transposable element P transposase (Drosophila melanogaster)" AED:0.10 eAED:0.10 QI:0/0.5/0.33/0.66/1/1/3/150/465